MGRAAVLFALLRTALCAYRAFQQSLTVDEASTFNNYVRGPWSRIYEGYDPNNHILYSMLAKLSIRVFGLSEFTLRLPSVVAGFFLMLGIYAVLETTIPSRWIRWTALVTLGLFPLMLDLSVAARGYGLGLTLLVWALYFVLRSNYLAAGALLGLGISANLTITFPALALMACPLLLGKGNLERRIQSVLSIAIPAAAIVALICYPVLRNAQVTQFYVGEPTISRALLIMVFTAIHAKVDGLGLFGGLTGTRVIEYAVLPALMVLLVGAAVRHIRREVEWRPSLVPLVVLLLSLIELVVVHYLFGLNYPVDRVGIYLLVLLGLAWAIGVSQIRNLPVRAVHGIVAGLLVIQFASQFETRYFELWYFDLPMKQVAQALREETRGKPANSVSVSATWFHTPALEFYRYYYGINALKPVERRMDTALAGFDYYVLNLKDDDSIRQRDRSRLFPLLTEARSGVLLAKEPVQAR